MYYAYVSAEETSRMGLNKLLKRFQTELLAVSDNSGVYKYTLPFHFDHQKTKYAVACTHRVITDMKKRGVFGVVIDRELHELAPLFISCGLEHIDGSNLHRLMLPQVFSLLTKDKNIDTGGLPIAISSASEQDILYLFDRLHHLDAEFILIGDRRMEAAAEKILDRYGITARVTNSLRRGILLYLGGLIPQITPQVEVLDLSKTMVRQSFTDIIIDVGSLPVTNLISHPTLAVTEMYLRLSYDLPLSDAYTRSGCRVKGIRYK